MCHQKPFKCPKKSLNSFLNNAFCFGIKLFLSLNLTFKTLDFTCLNIDKFNRFGCFCACTCGKQRHWIYTNLFDFVFKPFCMFFTSFLPSTTWKRGNVEKKDFCGH